MNRIMNSSTASSETRTLRVTIGLLVVEIALSLVVIALMSSAQGCGRGVVTDSMTHSELAEVATAEGTDDLCELADAMMAAADRGDTVQAERLARVLEEAMGLMPDEQGTKEGNR